VSACRGLEQVRDGESASGADVKTRLFLRICQRNATELNRETSYNAYPPSYHCSNKKPMNWLRPVKFSVGTSRHFAEAHGPENYWSVAGPGARTSGFVHYYRRKNHSESRTCMQQKGNPKWSILDPGLYAIYRPTIRVTVFSILSLSIVLKSLFQETFQATIMHD
jgi:hypothetical protein